MVQGLDPTTDAYSVAKRRNLGIGNSFAVLSVLAWAAGFPAAELLLETWPPLTLITARLFLAVALLIPLWALIDGPGALRQAQWGRGQLVGGICFGAGTYLLLIAQSLTDPVTVALIASAAPVAATLIEVGQRSRRLNARFVFGLTAAVAGGVVATSTNAPAQLGLGALAAVVSAFLFCWGSMATVRDFPELSHVGRATITLAGAAQACGLILAIIHIAGIDLRPSAPVDTAQLTYLIIYAVAGMAFSQVMWIASVGRLGVAVASFHMNAAPFHVMVIMLALGAEWNWIQALGAAVVGLGVIIAQRS